MPRSKPRQRKRRPGSRKPASQRAPDLRIRWHGLGPLLDARGREVKRFYKLETLTSAAEYAIRQHRDHFIVPSIQAVMGAAPLHELAFDLFLETPARLIFRLRATNANRKQAAFAFIAAKNADPYSKRLAAEHADLARFHDRAPNWILKPLCGGRLYLPDRYRRAAHGRKIFAYLAQWPRGFHRLAIGKNRCFFVGGEPVQPLTAAQTEELKAQMVAIVARTYDRERHDCISLPDVTAGDFLATRPQSGALKLKLIGCHGALKNMNPAKLVHRIVDGHYTWHGRPFRLAPQDPEQLYRALAEALGSDTAHAWLAQYRDAVNRGKLAGQEELPLEIMDGMGVTQPGPAATKT